MAGRSHWVLRCTGPCGQALEPAFHAHPHPDPTPLFFTFYAGTLASHAYPYSAAFLRRGLAFHWGSDQYAHPPAFSAASPAGPDGRRRCALCQRRPDLRLYGSSWPLLISGPLSRCHSGFPEVVAGRQSPRVGVDCYLSFVFGVDVRRSLGCSVSHSGFALACRWLAVVTPP